ncbi:MAG: MBL fold metallo-hydrolase [Bacillota bacterium]|nr:MBL fold metallo-hydrolase [Bacillota bacterium]
MDVRITILVENTTTVPGLLGEYGFSALIEVDGQRFLFDTGNGEAIMSNASQLGIDLSTIEALVISHGHFDHTGGVMQLLPELKKPIVYAHPEVFARHQVSSGPSQTRYIGAPFTKDDLLQAGAEFVAVDNFTRMTDNIYITGSIPRLTDYEDAGGPFIKEVNGELLPDPIEDDMALVITHPQGLIIVSGCAHAGMINMINYALESTRASKVLAFIGGTHLNTANEKRLRKTVADLKRIDPHQLIVCHCTGFAATSLLYRELPTMTQKGETGMVFKY